MTLDPGLYVTATPIGNLRDITLRALDTLKDADLILCEDTRVTGKLLRAHDIRTSMRAYHDHSDANDRNFILSELAGGKAIALVSDAGTPLISDPGFKLVNEVREAGHSVFTIPGPSSLTAALSIAGAPTDQILFGGFLPSKTLARQKYLDQFSGLSASLAFFESGRRLSAALEDIQDVLGHRKVSIARELTKMYEEVRRAPVGILIDAYQNSNAPKGEIVLIIHPPEKHEATQQELEALLSELLSSHSLKDAVARATEKSGMPKKHVYSTALQLRSLPK